MRTQGVGVRFSVVNDGLKAVVVIRHSVRPENPGAHMS
jgi:hypothetical protein